MKSNYRPRDNYWWVLRDIYIVLPGISFTKKVNAGLADTKGLTSSVIGSKANISGVGKGEYLLRIERLLLQVR